MIEQMELAPNVQLYCFRDTRFKQSCLSIQLLRPMDKKEASSNALIPAVLLRGCEGAQDLQQITRRLDDLYGASVGTLVRQIGDHQTLGLYAGFISDRYTLGGDKILKPMADFLRTLLFQPVLEQGVFRRDYVQSETRNLISALETQKNDKRAYAMQQLLHHMCKADSYGISRLGDVQTLQNLDARQVYDHYERVLKTSPVAICYVGEAAMDAVAELLRPIWSELAAEATALPEQRAFKDGGGGVFEEKLDVAQGRVNLGFVTDTTIRSPEFAAMQVLNSILGGGMTSKLFMQVREKQSLCYDISSGYRSSKGIVTVSAGVDCKEMTRARDEICRQLELCRQGEITREELTAAKEGLISAIRAVHDSPGTIEDYYMTAMLSGSTLTPRRYGEQVAQVTASQVVQQAKTLKLHTEFRLMGVQE